MKILSVIGARPQIIKSAAITLPILEHYAGRITEVVVHTGQHYDVNMSGNFFSELGLPLPKYNLAIGSGTQGGQTAAMITEIEKIIQDEKPNIVLIYGDTNSTVAAALAASKMGVAVAHIEAGMRSFNKSMPEEINRVLSDHVSSFLFCPTNTAVENLRLEGFRPDGAGQIDSPLVMKVGDIMYDNAMRLQAAAHFDFESKNIHADSLLLATIHRVSNTQSAEQILEIFEGINRFCSKREMKALIPLHPRTKQLLERSNNYKDLLLKFPFIVTCEPLSYLEILACLRQAKLVITDSGGLQKEAAFFNTPSVVLRAETEWTELVEFGLARLSDTTADEIVRNCELQIVSKATLPREFYGNGQAGQEILDALLAHYAHIK